MKMPTTTNNKVEAKAPTEMVDAAKQCLNCLEKKVRNLEKRKTRIEQNQEKAKKGTKLEKEQEVSLQQYEQVNHDLEFARELHKQFLQIYQEHEKMVKKQAKREKVERQAIEIKRMSEILQLQSLLDLLGGDKVREDFKTGKHGAVVLTEDNLNQLDELYQAISPSRDDSGEYPQKLTAAAEHLVNILEGKDRQVVGTTYKELKELITLISECGYFESAQRAEMEEAKPVTEPSAEVEEFPDLSEDTNAEKELLSEGLDQVADPQQQQQQQPIDLTMGTTDGAQSQRDLPAQPLNTLEQDAFFAPSTTPYQADTDSQFSAPSHTSASRVPDFQSFTNNRPFQFIQTSYVMPEGSGGPGVVDPAVIVAQPAASGLQFISQGFDTGAGPQAPQAQPPPPQQQAAQQQTQSVADMSQNSVGLQSQPTAQQPQQQQQPSSQDYNSQTFVQAGLQQNLQTDSLFPVQPVDDASNSHASHSGIMGQIRDDGVSASPYEIPPSIPLPPSQSQDQSQLDQQQQQEKKFQMNASAPVFQSMYTQVASGPSVPVTVPPPSVPVVADTQAPPPSSDFTSTPTPSGDFGQPSTGDFQQGYQGNNGFSGGYSRGGRGGFRGGRGGTGGSGGNRNGGPNGNAMQNGFSGRGGSANTNNSRGGRGGTYQGYPPSNNYRPDSFQGGYNASGFAGPAFQKRGGINNAGGPGSGYPRGGASGNMGRGGAGGMRGGMARGGGGAPRAPRGGFVRPMSSQ